MVHKNKRLAIPSNNEYSIPQIKTMIDEVERLIEREINIEEWNNL
jgi:hypothetical protein